jgi:hypothetical protein
MAPLKGRSPSKAPRAGLETFLFGEDNPYATLFKTAGFRFRVNTFMSKFMRRRMVVATSMPSNLSGLGFFDAGGNLLGAVTKNLGAEGSKHPWTFRHFANIDGALEPSGHFYVEGPQEIVQSATSFFRGELARVVAYRTPTKERKPPRKVSLAGKKTTKKRPRGRVKVPRSR